MQEEQVVVDFKTKKRIGSYEIVGRLGRGGMATVYKARSVFTGRLVALKILQPRDEIFVDLVGWKELCRVFLEEAKVMGALEHPNVAQVIDCGEHENCPFIVLEYYSHSVGDVVAEGYKVEAPSRILSTERTAHYVSQTLKGLQRLHAAGVVHRDIKPFNLMLTSNNIIKIIDFGLSRVRGEELLDIPGMQVGTPYYTAPEQRANPESVDGRADLFSLGVMAYRMLTGVLSFSDGGKFIAPSFRNEEVVSSWDVFLKTVLATDPDERFASAEEMLVALEKVNAPKSTEVIKNDKPEVERQKEQLRSEACRLRLKEIRGHLQLDALLRPEGYHCHDLVAKNDFVVHDNTADLIWQRRGSGYTMNWQQAFEYVAHLNEIEYQGRSNWRLPTMVELVVLLDPDQRSGGCWINRMFESSIHWLWSCDPSTKKQSWMVDFAEGYVGRLDKDGAASVCAVSSIG